MRVDMFDLILLQENLEIYEFLLSHRFLLRIDRLLMFSFERFNQRFVFRLIYCIKLLPVTPGIALEARCEYNSICTYTVRPEKQ